MALPRALWVNCALCGKLLEVNVVHWDIEMITDEDSDSPGVAVMINAFVEHTCEES